MITEFLKVFVVGYFLLSECKTFANFHNIFPNVGHYSRGAHRMCWHGWERGSKSHTISLAVKTFFIRRRSWFINFPFPLLGHESGPVLGQFCAICIAHISQGAEKPPIKLADAANFMVKRLAGLCGRTAGCTGHSAWPPHTARQADSDYLSKCSTGTSKFEKMSTLRDSAGMKATVLFARLLIIRTTAVKGNHSNREYRNLRGYYVCNSHYQN